jgi:hypothetical protein
MYTFRWQHETKQNHIAGKHTFHTCNVGRDYQISNQRYGSFHTTRMAYYCLFHDWPMVDVNFGNWHFIHPMLSIYLQINSFSIKAKTKIQ